MKKVVFITLVVLSCFTVTSVAGEIKEITWENLLPELPPQENPLEGMDEEERGFVEWIIYLREYLPNEEVNTENQKYFDEMNEGIPALKKKGIDVDKILADRRYRSTAVNDDLDGKVIKLAGYLLPLDLSGKSVKDFLLVPFVGACIHVPPPPPNQIVHGVSPTEYHYELDQLFKPVAVTGKLKVGSLSKELFLGDGTGNIDIGYSLAVSKIEEYKP